MSDLGHKGERTTRRRTTRLSIRESLGNMESKTATYYLRQALRLIWLLSTLTFSLRGLSFLLRSEKLLTVYRATRTFPRVSWAQDAEDIFILDLTDQLRTPKFYVDIGAHHPFRFSITNLLYESGWSGINVDYPDKTMELFRKYRPRDTNVKALVGFPRSATYFQFEESALNTIVEEVAEQQARRGFSICRTEAVVIQRMSSVLHDNHAPAEIGLLSIDVEGAEMEILEDLFQSAYRFSLILVELGKDTSTKSIAVTLEEAGYSEITKFKRSSLYVSRDFDSRNAGVSAKILPSDCGK